MNNKFDKLTENMTQSMTRRTPLTKLSVGLALLVGLSALVSATDTPARGPIMVPVTGNSDWSIVPPALTPPFVLNGTDGDIYVRHLPLVGKISLAGRDVSIQGKISADFNAELDATFSGVVWAPVTITATMNGRKTVIFEGNASGNTVGLVSAGVIQLEGRGPFQGDRLEIEFTEIGPGNSDGYTLEGVLIQHPAR